MIPETRECPCCKELKRASEYYAHKSTGNGLSPYCKECTRESNRKSYKKYRQDRLARKWTEYREKREIEMKSPTEETKARRDKRSRMSKLRYERNKERLLKKGNEWRNRNPERVAAYARKRRASRRGAAINDLTMEQWNRIQQAYGHRCVYCGKKMKGRLSQDHITPLSKGGNHTVSNVVPACVPCNSSKGNRPLKIEIQPMLLVAP